MGGLRQVAQSLRRAGQRVIAVNHAGRGLHLLPALDPAPAPIAGDRPDVVVEGRDEARARRLPDNVAALRIVGTHDLVVMQKVDIRRRAGLLEQFEATRVERAALRPNQVARVMNRHLPLFHTGAHPGDVVAAAVAAGEHLAVAVERARDRRRQVFEFAGSNRLGSRLSCQIHGITSQKPHMGHASFLPISRLHSGIGGTSATVFGAWPIDVGSAGGTRYNRGGRPLPNVPLARPRGQLCWPRFSKSPSMS